MTLDILSVDRLANKRLRIVRAFQIVRGLFLQVLFVGPVGFAIFLWIRLGGITQDGRTGEVLKAFHFHKQSLLAMILIWIVLVMTLFVLLRSLGHGRRAGSFFLLFVMSCNLYSTCSQPFSNHSEVAKWGGAETFLNMLLTSLTLYVGVVVLRGVAESVLAHHWSCVPFDRPAIGPRFWTRPDIYRLLDIPAAPFVPAWSRRRALATTTAAVWLEGFAFYIYLGGPAFFSRVTNAVRAAGGQAELAAQLYVPLLLALVPLSLWGALLA